MPDQDDPCDEMMPPPKPKKERNKNDTDES